MRRLHWPPARKQRQAPSAIPCTTRWRDNAALQALAHSVRQQPRQAVPAGGRSAALDADDVLLVDLHALAALQALHLGHSVDDLRAQRVRQAVIPAKLTPCL